MPDGLRARREEARRVQQPGKREHAVQSSLQNDRVQDDPALLAEGNVRPLNTRSPAPGIKVALRTLPKTVADTPQAWTETISPLRGP